MKAFDRLVRALEQEGVAYVFGIPGEETLDLLDSLSRSKIRFMVTRHEQAAGFMAATVGRLTGKAAVCLSTLGPGATNLVTAAAYAQLGAMPMLMITGQKPIKHRKQGRWQIVDVVDMMRPITKFTHQVVAGENIPFRVREAFRRAEEERPGAVHLELPEDIAAEQTTSHPLQASYRRRPVVESKAVDHALALLRGARHPLLLIGAGANRQLTARTLRAFIDKQAMPFITSQMGQGVVDETHPLWLGNAALSTGGFLHRAIVKCDLILNVGHDTVEKPPFIMRESEPRRVIHIDFSSALVDPVYFPQAEPVGDIAHSTEQLNSRLTPPEHWDFSPFERIRKALVAHLQLGRDDPTFPLVLPRLVADVRKAMPEDGLITSFCQYAEAYGAHGHVLKRTEDLLPLLRRCLAGGGVHVIEVPVDYSDNDRFSHEDPPKSCKGI